MAGGTGFIGTAGSAATALTPHGSGLRIAHVAEAFGGGLLEVVRAMAEGAAKDGCEVLIAYGRRPETPDEPAELISDAVEVRGLPWGNRSPIEQLRAGRALRRLLAEFEPDVVHLHSSFAGLVGGVVAGGRWPVVYTPHAFASCLPGLGGARRRMIAAAERLAISRARIVGAVSTSEADTAYALGARRVRVVRNGIPELDEEPRETAKVLTMPALRPRVIAGGRLVGQRRPDACARILGALSDEADVAWVGGGGEGDGAWADTTREQLASAGVPVTGWLPREQALEEMARATVYLHWTAWDGQALSLLEAMAEDTLVIASDIEPNREVLGHSQVCATEEEAVLLLRRVLGDPGLMREMLQQQRSRRMRFGAQRMAQEWLALYEDVITEREPEPAPGELSPLPADAPRAHEVILSGEPSVQPEPAI
jgi:glycosyltransferase involved in cell wall biosynthesis